MTNVPLKKVTVMGRLKDKADIVKDIQKCGVMHIIPLTESEKQLRASPAEFYEALRFLIQCPEHRTPVRNEKDLDANEIIQRVIEIKYEEIAIRHKQDKLKRHLREIRKWGNFDIPDPEEIGGHNLYFYKVPHFKASALKQIPDLVFQEVYTGNLHAYIVVIAKEEPAPALIPGKQIRFKRKSLKEVTEEIDALSFQREELIDERRRMTRYIPFLFKNIDRTEDRTIYEYVMDRTLDEEDFFVIQGWVPADKTRILDSVKNMYRAAIYIEEPAENDKPPTLFKNKSFFQGGEELVRFYQMPAYRGWDPSIVMYLSFAVFFAMIMSDAGYAVLLGIFLIFFWNKLDKTPVGRRMRTLGFVISGTSFVYGTLVGSYFGHEPSFKILEQANILDINNFEMMMKVSILTGVLHLMMANLIMSWKTRNSFHALSYIGWIVIFVSATSLWILSENIGHQPFFYPMAAGALLVFLFTSTRAVASVKAFLMRFIDGLLGLINISKAFGDILSYMRLFALGLASASLAMMFNHLADQVSQNIAGVGTFLALIVLLFGHGLNFLLAIMGGVVHGLRLNLIEFFSWSIKDEGYAFEPFRIKEE